MLTNVALTHRVHELHVCIIQLRHYLNQCRFIFKWIRGKRNELSILKKIALFLSRTSIHQTHDVTNKTCVLTHWLPLQHGTLNWTCTAPNVTHVSTTKNGHQSLSLPVRVVTYLSIFNSIKPNSFFIIIHKQDIQYIGFIWKHILFNLFSQEHFFNFKSDEHV